MTLTLTLVLAGPAPAQRFTLDLGGAAVRYADTLNTGTFSVTPALRLESSRASLRAAAAFSQLTAGSWTTQGSLGASLYTPNMGPLLGEIAATAGGSSHEDGTRTGQTIGMARAHVMNARAGAWAGVGAGSTWDGDVWRAVRQAEAGGWARFGTASTLLSVTPTSVDDTVDYVDTQLSFRMELQRVELHASAGHRSGDPLPALGRTVNTWGSAGIVAWVTSWAGIVATVGSYPVDLTQGFPGGRYATVGIRFGSAPRRRGVDPLSDPTSNGDASNSAIAAFTIETAKDGTHTLRLRAPSAQRLEVTGDFTQWQPLAMNASADGWWAITLPIPVGTHQMNVRIDGGSWTVPPGLTVITDEFGGRVAILVVRPSEM